MICSNVINDIGKPVDFFKYRAGSLWGLGELGSKLWEPQGIRHARLRHPGFDPESCIQRFGLTG